MANVRNPTKLQLGATPGKLCLVAVLGVILMAVLWTEFAQEPSTPAPNVTGPRPVRSRVAAQGTLPKSRFPTKLTTTSKTTSRRPTNRKIWNDFTMDDALMHNPFAVPVAVQPPATKKDDSTSKVATREVSVTSESEQEYQEHESITTLHAAASEENAVQGLQNQGASIVFRHGQQWLAVVGEKTVQVGDMLEDFKVVEIGPHGVLIEQSAQE